MDGIGAARGGHVDADVPRRHAKAEKIRRVVAARTDLSRARVLDLGAGSGLLCAFLAPHCREIIAADRDIAPFDAEGIEVFTVDDTLPFPDGRFDVAIYNQVIEHVGDRHAQSAALGEIHRVLSPGGLLYLACPNRWTIVEPHYNLPFLSWLPQRLADAWVRGTGKGTWYDCNPPGRGTLIGLMTEAGFAVEDASREAIDHVLDLEVPEDTARIMRLVPWGLFRPILPAFVMIGRRAG